MSQGDLTVRKTQQKADTCLFDRKPVKNKMSFSNLRRNSQSTLAMLQDQLEKSAKSESSGGGGDDRLWKPTLDNKTGTANYTIRFLPAPANENLPWQKLVSHYFEGPNGDKYVENSLSTFGEPDPVAQLQKRLWDEGTEASKEQYYNQKRKVYWYSNIYVLKDARDGGVNEGKTFLYRYPKKIYDKIQGCFKPEYAGEEAYDPTDFWQGANFNLRIKTQGGYWNYDDSGFGARMALSADDDELEGIYNNLYSLEEIISRDKFKSYDQLKERLEFVLGTNRPAAAAPVVKDEIDEELDWAAPSAPAPQPIETAAPTASGKEDEDAFSFFQNLKDAQF